MLYQRRTFAYSRSRKEGVKNRIFSRLVGVGIVVPLSATDMDDLPVWCYEKHRLEHDNLIAALLR